MLGHALFSYHYWKTGMTMKRILIGLTASAALLSAIGSASACNRSDVSTQNSVTTAPFIQLAQASGNGSSTGGKAVDQQFIDPNVRSAPGQDPAPMGAAGDTDVTGSTTTTPDASQSKRKNTEEPTNQSGSK